MVDTSNITGVVMGWASSSVFWLIIILVVVGAGFGGLFFRKRRRLEYPVEIYTNVGNGKFATRMSRAGWFKSKSTLFGLIDFGGETRLMLKDGRQILAGSLSDLQEINGVMGFRVYRKEDDPKIVVPISKSYIENKRLIMTIAPADYRDASTEIINSAIKETQTNFEKIAPVIFYGIIVIFSLIVILFIIQFANKQVDKAGEILVAVAQHVNVNPSIIYNSTAP